MTQYEAVFNETALRAVLIEGSPERARLLQFIAAIADDPGRSGDFIEESECGRRINVFLCDDWMISVWTDHAVKEVRIVNIERV